VGVIFSLEGDDDLEKMGRIEVVVGLWISTLFSSLCR